MTSVMLFDSDARRFPICVVRSHWIPETLADVVGKTVATAEASVGRGIGDETAAVTPEAIGLPCFTSSSGLQVGFGQEVQNPTNRQAIYGERAAAENP